MGVDPYDAKLLKVRLEELAINLPHEVTTRPMMGGFIGYADGKPFVSLSTGGFGVKLLPDDQERLLTRKGAERMRHLPDQPPSKTYVAFSRDDLDNDSVMIEWLSIAAASAPTPKPRKR